MTLDDVFGPRDVPQPTNDGSDMTKEVGRTNWPLAEERLRPFLDAYEAWVGFHPASAQVRTLWTIGARNWVDEFGEGSLWMFKDAMTYCEKHKMRPKSPKGLLFYGLDHKGEPQEDWGKYFKK